MSRRSTSAPLTARRKATFLTELARIGVATRAAKAASPDAIGTGLQTFKDERKRDPEFARQWDDALAQHSGDLVAELYRRAMVGDQIPIQNAKGDLIGWRSIRSDKLLLEAVRAHAPMFTPRSVSEVTAKVSNVPIGLDALSPESQDELARILEREQRRLLAEAPSDGVEPSASHSTEESEA